MIRYESKEKYDMNLVGSILHFRYKIDIEDYTLEYDPKKDEIVLTILPKHLNKMRKFAKERNVKLFRNKYGKLVVYLKR